MKRTGLPTMCQRVRTLLAAAPSDRAWRRRGYLVICRAHQSRVRESRATSDIRDADRAVQRTRGRGKVAGAGMVVGDNTAHEQPVVIGPL